MLRHIATFCLVGVCAVTAQTSATVPPICETLPGNAAVSMPLRWSEGTLQVFIEGDLLPQNFVGETITGLRMRRSVLPGDGDYAALTRTLTIRAGFQPFPATQMQGALDQNRPTNFTVVFGPAPVTVAATTARGPATTVGEEFLQITFTQPLLVAAGTLYLEFETTDGPLTIETDNWVDAVWMEDAIDEGLVVQVGDGSCTSRTEPTTMTWTSGKPVTGEDIGFELAGAPPTVGLCLAWAGLDPENAPAGPTYTGWGGTFGPADPLMIDCYMWAPFEVTWFGVADATGKFGVSFTMPAAAIGLRLGMQGGWLDDTRPVVPLSFSNGVQLVSNNASIEDHCSCMYFPGTTQVSPWPAFHGQMPVIVLDY